MRKESTPFKGSWDLRKDTGVSSQGFLIVGYVPDLELKTMATQTSQQVQRKKKAPTKICSLAKEPEKGPLARKNTIDSNHCMQNENPSTVSGTCGTVTKDLTFVH